jgi:hypothetical protein
VDVLMVSEKEVRPGRMDGVSLRSANWTAIPRARQMVDTLFPRWFSHQLQFLSQINI